jgi:hypothetical protein
MEEDPDTGWRRQVLYLGPTSFLEELCVHAGLFSSQVTPHPPHCHGHEELHVALSDNLEFLCGETDSGVTTAQQITRDSLLFADSGMAHTFRNSSTQPAAYLHFRWKSPSPPHIPARSRLKFFYSPGDRNGMFRQPMYRACETMEVYSGPTRYLSRFRVLFIRLLPGGLIPMHRHPHEVIFALFRGTVEILGKKTDAPGFAFMGTQMPHCLVNPGSEPAELYAFELYPEA